MRLSWGMFGASAMKVEGVGLHLTALKVKQLQEELVAWALGGHQVGAQASAPAAAACALIIAAVAECEGTEPEAA